MNFKFQDLEKWSNIIEKRSQEFGLDCYEQEFEIVSYEDMLCYEAYSGMPSHYPHWSFGKSYEKLKTLYSYDLTGLPYEIVINSDPCIAYLMKENSLVTQILTMAHVYGHNDFFKNNRMFKEGTNASLTIGMFKNHGDRIRSYIQDPSIGYDKVERILDVAHAIKYQDILPFLLENAPLEDWEKDVLTIVLETSKYFLPQIESKIMNEGWASWWHYKILQSLELPTSFQLEFLKIHNMVIAPNHTSINPYYVGFKIWESLDEIHKDNPQELFRIRQVERDASFIRNYLTFDLCRELNLFTFKEEEQYYLVSQVANEEGWKEIRNQLALLVGVGGIPCISVDEVNISDGSLILSHSYDDRELHLSYASETLKYIQKLWTGKVILKTVLNNIPRCIVCSEGGKISVKNC